MMENDNPHLLTAVHDTQKPIPIRFNVADVTILRELGAQYAEIASLQVQNERKQLWSSLNDLKKVKPLIWVNEVCWNELDVDDELRLQTSSEFTRRIELHLRRLLYQWDHFQGDMVVEPYLFSPYIIQNTGVGVTIEADSTKMNPRSHISSRHFHNQFHTEDDILKIKVPIISYDEKTSDEFFWAYKTIFEGIVKIERQGTPGFWFAPWDDLVFWMGADNVLTNLADRPNFMHKIIEKLVSVYLAVLEQFESKGLLASNNCNTRIGSGAYGYSDQLPKLMSNDGNVEAVDIWGSSTPQIFDSVSPSMHKEFGIDYEVKWLERFGLTYYGCCEALHNKIEMLRCIPNLRKLSLSPWCDLKIAVEAIQQDYVVSLKPNSFYLAMDNWHPEIVKKELKEKLDILGDHSVEIVLKDISTVRNKPHRLREWVKIAVEVAECYA